MNRDNWHRSRNARFAPPCLYAYVAFEETICGCPGTVSIAIKMKRFEQPMVGFLSREHIEAIHGRSRQPHLDRTARPDDVRSALQHRRPHLRAPRHACGRSDAWAYRVGSHPREGQERTFRTLWSTTTKDLNAGASVPRADDKPLFPSRSGGDSQRVGFTDRLKRAAASASNGILSLQSGGSFRTWYVIRRNAYAPVWCDITVIALWLGDESPMTTASLRRSRLADEKTGL